MCRLDVALRLQEPEGLVGFTAIDFQRVCEVAGGPGQCAFGVSEKAEGGLGGQGGYGGALAFGGHGSTLTQESADSQKWLC